MGFTTEEEPQTIRKVWHFSESQWSVICQAIKVIGLTTGSDSDAYAIELMAAEYLSGVGVKQAG